MIDRTESAGMRTFTVIWFGQLVSLLGTGMTRFALLIWAYEQTGQATTLALLGFFAWMPLIVLSPLAGVWVDRLDRRLVMIGADLGAGLTTLLMMALFLSGNLAIWHLYLLGALASVFEVFQGPAFSAATTMLVAKKHYARANGMRTLARDAAQIAAPLAGGALLAFIGIGGVMLIDVATFLVAVGTLLVVRIPAPPPDADEERRAPFRRQITFGFRYIFQRKGLLGLMLMFMGIHFFAALTYFSILPALILARTGGDELVLASVQAALGGAGVVGGLVVSTWGLPRRKIHAVLACTAASFFCGDLLFAVGRTPLVWVAAACMAAFFIPFIGTANNTIWQMKVAPGVQGRVFSIRSLFQNLAQPVAFLIAGPLADWVFEPAMQPDGALAPVFGPLVGVGPGAGMGLMFACTALLGAAMSLSGYLIPAVRNVENDLPDHDAEPVAPAAALADEATVA